MLRFPPSLFKRVKAAEVATMVKDEVEPLGGFIGDAFVQPALLGGQALTALVFIVVQNFWLGAIAVGIVAVQGVIIPRMRRRLIRLGRERQLTARELSGRVGEIVDGIGTIHIHDTSNYERADIADPARPHLQDPLRPLPVEVPGQVHQQFPGPGDAVPVLSRSAATWRCKGSLDIGQLVAVIAAYKDLPGPLKDLIDWDQARQDVQVKYQQVVEQFTVDTIIDPKHPGLRRPIASARSTTRSAAVNLSLADDSGARLLERVSLQIQAGRDSRAGRHGGERRRGACRSVRAARSGRKAAGSSLGDRDLLRTAGIGHRTAHVLCLVRRLLLPGHARATICSTA